METEEPKVFNSFEVFLIIIFSIISFTLTTLTIVDLPPNPLHNTYLAIAISSLIIVILDIAYKLFQLIRYCEVKRTTNGCFIYTTLAIGITHLVLGILIAQDNPELKFLLCVLLGNVIVLGLFINLFSWMFTLIYTSLTLPMQRKKFNQIQENLTSNEV